VGAVVVVGVVATTVGVTQACLQTSNSRVAAAAVNAAAGAAAAAATAAATANP
jgi:hypothetical protein